MESVWKGANSSCRDSTSVGLQQVLLQGSGVRGHSLEKRVWRQGLVKGNLLCVVHVTGAKEGDSKSQITKAVVAPEGICALSLGR